MKNIIQIKGITESEYPVLNTAVKKNMDRFNIEKVEIKIIKTGMEANATSYFKNKIQFSEKLIKMMNGNEIEAIVAHELSHIKNRDCIKKSPIFFILILLAFILVYALYLYIVEHAIHLLLVVFFISIIGIMILHRVSIEQELRADRESSLKTSKPDSMKTALEKMYSERFPIKNFKYYCYLFTHPDLKRRNECLELSKKTLEMNMQSTTIEQYLDNLKRTSAQLIREVEANHINTGELKSLILEKSDEMGVEREKFENVLINIELLFDAVPNKEYKTLFINHFDELSNLNGTRFEFWLNSIEFNEQIEDDLKISYLCSLYDFEFIQWFLNALEKCDPNPKQNILIHLQNYQYVVEGYFLKTLNIILCAMMLPSGILELKYNDRNGNPQKIKVKSYKDISKTSLNNKLLLLECSTHTELGKIAKACNKDLRNAVAHHSFTLDETNQKIRYQYGELQFTDFMTTANELLEYRLIIVESFRYYSMKCYFESKGLLKK